MNDIQKFTNDEFGTIRTVEQDGKVLFCGKDVATALGYSNPRKALIDHCKGVTKRDAPTSSGIQSMSFITEGDLYRLIASSKLPSAQKFESWVFDEVLPSIRRQGGYMTARADETPEQIMARALMLAKDTMDRQQREIAELRPKALYADAVTASDGTCLVGELAKMMR